jgi:hypothetical protein
MSAAQPYNRPVDEANEAGVIDQTDALRRLGEIPAIADRAAAYRVEGPDPALQPGLFNLWGDVIDPYLVRPSIESGEVARVSEVFGVLEALSIGGNACVREFVQIELGDEIGPDPVRRTTYFALMGNATRRLVEHYLQTRWPQAT